MGAHFRTSLTIIMIFEISDTERKREHELRKYFTEFWTKPGASYDAFIAATPMAEGVTFEENELGWWARPANHDSKRALLYVHGGGYLQGSAKAYRGLASQLVRRTGIAALGKDIDAAIVQLGDMPGVTSNLLDRLMAGFSPVEGRSICVPTVGGKRGNPVLWARRFFAEMSKVEGDTGAKHLIGEHADLVCEVEMTGEAAITDIDTPEALAAWRAKAGK